MKAGDPKAAAPKAGDWKAGAPKSAAPKFVVSGAGVSTSDTPKPRASKTGVRGVAKTNTACPGPSAHPARTRQRGVTYIGVLLLAAALGVAASQAVAVRATQQQRDRETQLLFVGDQFRRAIVSYYNSGDGGRYPASLQDLVEDNRSLRPKRHLRRIYVDPLTDSIDWGVVRGPGGTIMGVFSHAGGKPIKQQNFPAGDEGFNDSKSYRDWVFVDARQAAQATRASGGDIGPAWAHLRPVDRS